MVGVTLRMLGARQLYGEAACRSGSPFLRALSAQQMSKLRVHPPLLAAHTPLSWQQLV